MKQSRRSLFLLLVIARQLPRRNAMKRTRVSRSNWSTANNSPG